ncbi:MAG: DUF4912 domain-containing protein [Spirochaetia bacterium]
MTSECLQQLTYDTLTNVLHSKGIELAPGTSKDEIITTLLEIIQEDRLEKEELNSLAIKIEGKKYDISQDEEFEAQDTETYLLPEDYNVTRLVMLLRDPNWAYVYWDLNDQELSKIQKVPFYKGTFLRVHETLPNKKTQKRVDSFDIPIKETDRSWYVNLPKSGTSYVTELIYKTNVKAHIITSSNEIFAPEPIVGRNKDKDHQWDEKTEEILRLSGMYEIGTSSYDSMNPQRIISLMDAKYIRSYKE